MTFSETVMDGPAEPRKPSKAHQSPPRLHPYKNLTLTLIPSLLRSPLRIPHRPSHIAATNHLLAFLLPLLAAGPPPSLLSSCSTSSYQIRRIAHALQPTPAGEAMINLFLVECSPGMLERRRLLKFG